MFCYIAYIVNIEDEPIFECYRMLMDYAFKNSKKFFLHVPDGLQVNDSVYNLFSEMKNHLIDVVPSYEFISTEYGEGEVHIFECNDYTNEIIRNKVTGLYDWRLPELPEDLGFIYENDEDWFTTISHENMGSIETESLKVVKELENIIEISKCISIRKKEI